MTAAPPQSLRSTGITPPAVIELTGVGKRYMINTDDAMLVRRLSSALRGKRATDLWAVRDLDLTVRQGETVGIVGRNGSGKTTLLRLLAGVSAPTTGTVRVVGSIAPLIGVGVGFNPELTGRENVFANGRILGLSQSVLERDFDEIVAFAELEDFIDTPVKFYSSGMFLRLAFAVAIHVEPEVLLVDEVLAVGDLAFQLKCFDRMRALQDRGTTIVIVTHNLGILERLASRTMVMHHGQMSFVGPVAEALDHYHELAHADAAARSDALAQAAPTGGEQLALVGGAAVELDVRVLDDEIVIGIDATFDREVHDPNLGLMASQIGGGPVYMLHTMPGEYGGQHGPDRPLHAEVRLDNALLTGRYAVQIAVRDRDGKAVLGQARTGFLVQRPRGAIGVADLAGEIAVNGTAIPLTGVGG